MTLGTKTIWFMLLMAALMLLVANAAKLPPMPPGTRTTLRSPKAAEFQKSLGARMVQTAPKVQAVPRGSTVVVSWDAQAGDVLESSSDFVHWSPEATTNPATIPALGAKLFRVRRTLP